MRFSLLRFQALSTEKTSQKRGFFNEARLRCKKNEAGLTPREGVPRNELASFGCSRKACRRTRKANASSN